MGDASLPPSRSAQRPFAMLRLLYCDNGGILRGKAAYIPSEQGWQRRLHEGVGLAAAQQAFVAIGEEPLAPVEGMGPIGEVRLVPDPISLLTLPHAPWQAVVMGDLRRLDGQPWEACPRTFLKRMLARLAAHGLRVEAATEHEWYLLYLTESGLVPAETGELLRMEGLDVSEPFVEALLAGLAEQGLTPLLVHSEYGRGQLELSIQHREALQAADAACLLRELVRGLVRLHWLRVSFAPKPLLEQPGSGAHLHLSLWTIAQNEAPARNLFADPQAPYGLSQQGRWFLGGLLRHLRGLLALTCASPNSYQRLQPYAWSSAYGCWGYEHREAALRVVSPVWGRETETGNLELRPVDHSGNPYLVLGAVLAAGLDGLTHHLEPGEPLSEDPCALSEEERARLGVQRLPTTLGEALDELERDPVLLEALGPLLARSYLAVKRAEATWALEQPPEAIADAYRFAY